MNRSQRLLHLIEQADFEQILRNIPALNFLLVTNLIWKTIRDEGLDQEFEKEDRKSWFYSEINIPEKDKQGLINFDDEMLDKYNSFDIALKEKYNMKYIDLINYELGKIYIVKYED